MSVHLWSFHLTSGLLLYCRDWQSLSCFGPYQYINNYPILLFFLLVIFNVMHNSTSHHSQSQILKLSLCLRFFWGIVTKLSKYFLSSFHSISSKGFLHCISLSQQKKSKVSFSSFSLTIYSCFLSTTLYSFSMHCSLLLQVTRKVENPNNSTAEETYTIGNLFPLKLLHLL